MQTRKLSFLGSAVAAFSFAALIASCGKDPAKSVVQDVKEPGLMKTWEGKCGNLKVADYSGNSFYKFSGNTFKEAYIGYEDENCKNNALEVLYQGEFDLKDKNDSGLRQVNLTYNKIFVRPLNETGQKLLEKSEACGIKTWPVNKPQEVTAAEKKGVCRLVGTVPSVDYNVVLLEDGKLYFGASGALEKKATKESDRPDKVNRDNVFQPSNVQID